MQTCPNTSEACPVLLRYKWREKQEVDDFWVYESSNFWYGPWECKRYTYEQGELRVRVEEERGDKEMDRYPLHYPSSKFGIMTCKDCQEVAGSTLVKGIELKMAVLIWCAIVGYLQ
jgi:hypothetical protein